MPVGQLFINGVDAYVNWGISLSSTALSTLMTPPPMKAFTENANRLQHGKRVLVDSPRYDVKEMTITFNLTAKNEVLFYSCYKRFCDDVLATGKINIRTSFDNYTEYKCLYISCTQFSEYIREMAVFTLKLVEPNPADRTVLPYRDPNSPTEGTEE